MYRSNRTRADKPSLQGSPSERLYILGVDLLDDGHFRWEAKQLASTEVQRRKAAEQRADIEAHLRAEAERRIAKLQGALERLKRRRR